MAVSSPAVSLILPKEGIVIFVFTAQIVENRNGKARNAWADLVKLCMTEYFLGLRNLADRELVNSSQALEVTVAKIVTVTRISHITLKSV